MSDTKRRVVKLGGTSVGSAARLRSSLGIVEASTAERPITVVTSARPARSPTAFGCARFQWR